MLDTSFLYTRNKNLEMEMRKHSIYNTNKNFEIRIRKVQNLHPRND